MSNYLLYGKRMIKNDNTMKDFAQSICEGVDTNNLSKEYFKDDFIDAVYEILQNDISRTDINYNKLMYKYRFEIGDLLYEIENNYGYIPSISFFSKESENSFNLLIKLYIEIHFDELINE